MGLYRPVHVKTLRSQKLRTLLTHRKLLKSNATAIENDLRATLRNFGLKVGMVGTVKFDARVKELIENFGKNASPCLTQKASYKGLGANSVEKHEPVSDIDAAVVDSPKALDPNRPMREGDSKWTFIRL